MVAVGMAKQLLLVPTVKVAQVRWEVKFWLGKIHGGYLTWSGLSTGGRIYLIGKKTAESD